MDGDSGAALVEFALLLPVLVLIFSGIMEFGSAYRVRDQMQHSVMSAGRVASQQSNSRYGDYETLRSLSSSLSSLTSSATINRVIIFRAPSNGQVPASCLAVPVTGSKAGVSGSCNVYSAAQVANASLSNFSTPAVCSAGAWDSSWCPLSRQSRTDQVGVYIELNYTTLTKLLPVSTTLKGTSVYAIEPLPIGA
jgi:hypothetical protein